MIWTVETLEVVLLLYKEQRLLWDPKVSGHFDKIARDLAFHSIANELQMRNVTGEDICRKLKTMRAAYQVEMRNIKTANLRGFFYKPTLKWFEVYKRIMDEIEEMKDWDVNGKFGIKSDDDISLEEEESAPNTYLLKLKGHRTLPKKNKLHAQIVIPKSGSKTSEAHQSVNPQILMETRQPTPPVREEVFTDESDDEFQLFADHIAEQLRSMSTHRAVSMQNQIQKLFMKDQEFHGQPAVFNKSK